MEKIYKKICLEDSRSRLQGLMPFIKCGDSGFTYVDDGELNGNWGGFPGNPVILLESGKTYMDMMLRYHGIWRQLRNGIYLKKILVNSNDCQCAPSGLSWTEQFSDDVDTYDFAAFDRKYFYLNEKYGTYFLNDEKPENLENEEFIVLVDNSYSMKECANYLRDDGDWGAYCRTVDDYLGRLEIPADKVKLGDRVPYVMYYADIPDYLGWMRDNENSDDCCVKELWKRRGGSEFMDYLESLEHEYETKCSEARGWIDEEESIPTVEVSLALRQNFADEGAYVPYSDTLYEDWDGNEEIGYMDSDGNIVSGDSRGALCWPYAMESKIWSAETEEEMIEVPSYLPNMMHTPYFYDDNKMMVPGTLKRFGPDGDGFFKCTYYRMESKRPAVKTSIRIKYKLDGGRTYSTTIDQGCTQTEISAWPQDPNTYQVVAPKVYGVRTSETSEETTGEYAVGQMYNGHEIIESTTYHTETYASYGWWEAVKVPFEVGTYEVADGEGTLTCRDENKYRVLTMLEAIDSLVPSQCNVDGIGEESLRNGDTYYFLVIYDNGPIDPTETESCDAGSLIIHVRRYIPASIPFDIGSVLNVTSKADDESMFYGDSVISSAQSGNDITLTYVIGGEFSGETMEYVEGTGTVLKETHRFEREKELQFSIDGVSAVTIYCNYIDFESDKKVGISSYNGLSGLTNTSLIMSMPVGDVMLSPSASTRSVIYKEDYLLGVSYEPETDINISYDNGTATAWEKHFKLGECNTMSDLVNYNNHGYFKNDL